MSDRRTSGRLEEPAADLGRVTLGGDPAGVYTGGERRWLPVYSPGGYRWRPRAGDQVLVVKAGGDREAPCITGRRQDEGDLESGEVRVSGGTGEVRLYSGGVALSGTVTVNGTPLNDFVQRIVNAAVSALSAEGGDAGGT